MTAIYGARDITRNPSLLRIKADESFVVEDKKAHKTLGVYLGVTLADEFFKYLKKQELLKSAKKIKESARHEYENLNGTISDGIH
ncbi:MAG: hypothetical protein U9R50_00540 [Campylobacterota bacterium]|nr:hypothetical protein [Campylobacterota bacterium]